jgi:hypothetical protein
MPKSQLTGYSESIRLDIPNLVKPSNPLWTEEMPLQHSIGEALPLGRHSARAKARGVLSNSSLLFSKVALVKNKGMILAISENV